MEESKPLNVFLPEEDRILPDGRIYITKALVKRNGEIWQFHKYDKDPSPSSPHGHNRETGEKLDVYTGIVYSRQGNQVRKLGKKQLNYLREKIRSAGFQFSDNK